MNARDINVLEKIIAYCDEIVETIKKIPELKAYCQKLLAKDL